MSELLSSCLQLLGRLHPMLLHLPIGLLIGLIAVEVYAMIRRSAGHRGMALLLVWLMAGSSVFTAVSGYVLGTEAVERSALLDRHQTLGIIFAAVCVATALALTALRRPGPYRALLLICGGLLVPTGHLGASMTHGPNFLTEPFESLRAKPAADAHRVPPAPAEPSTNTQPTVAVSEPVPDVPDVPPHLSVYTQQIAPILTKYCTECHGEVRQKGRLALHTLAAIERGGKDGPAIMPGRPADSPLVQRMRLPADDDAHMPPLGQPQPAEADIAAIEAWLASWPAAAGSQPSETVVPSPDPALPAVTPPAAAKAPAAESTAASAGGQPSMPPLPEVAPADPSAVVACQQMLVHVEPMAQGSHLLMLDFSAAVERMDETQIGQLLEPLLPHLAELRLDRAKVGDDTARLLADAIHLRRLSLRGTGVTDAGLAALRGLTSLRELVLAQTPVTDTAVEALVAMPALQRVYLWHTGFTPEGAARLRSARPTLDMDIGAIATAPALEAESELVFTSDAPLPGEAPPSPAPATQTLPATSVSLKPINTTCPVSGQPIDPRYLVVYEGKVIGFCCPNCPGPFWADPAKFAAALAIKPQ